MLSDIEIAQQNRMEKIQVIANKCGLTPDDIEQYGHYKAKISFDAIRRLESKPDGKLVLVTAITPTPAGEGKSTTSIGLVQGLQKIGKNAIATLREPSLGPVFGIRGGAAGGGLTEEQLDTPIGFDELVKLGSMMGSGGMIVLDEDNCMVDVARFYMDFIVDESCGKCTPCRVGTKRMLELLEQICDGKGTMETLDELELLASTIQDTALCGLGQTAPNPVLSTIHQFRDEYIAHIVDKKCPAGVCKELLQYEIDEDKCRKCGLCAKQCPVGAISGELGKVPYVIDQEKCIKCGQCIKACHFNVIERK